jgi:tetratricopeptide (TPR) repeat protein
MSMSGDVSHDVNPSLSSAVSSEVITAHTFPGSITKKNNKVKAKVERTLKNISSTLSPLRRKKKQYSPKVAKHGVAASSGKDGDTTVKAAITALNPSQSIDVHTTITIPCASPEDDMQFPPINFREAFQNQPRSRPINFREAFQNQPRSRLCQHVWGSIGDTDMRLKMAMVQMRSNVAKERMLARDNLLLCLSARERQCGAHCLESLAVYLKLIALLSPGHPDDGSFDKDDCRSRPLELLGFVESAMMVIQHNPGRTSAADRAELFVRQAQIHLELGHAGKAYDALRGHAVDLHRVLNLEKQKHQINPNENTTTEIIQISSLLIDIARSYLEHDQSHGAKSVVQEALGLGERNFLMLEDEAELLFLLGLLKEMEGDNESAKETYASALETRRTANAGPSKEGSLSYTSLATIMCHYGSIQSKLGEYESACESLQAASIMVADQICDQLNTAAKICSVPTTHDLLQTLNEIAGDVESICHYMNKKNAVTHLGNFYEKLLCCVSATATMKSSCSSSRVTSLRMHIFAGFMTSCVMHGRDLLKNRTPDMAILLCQKPIQMMKCDDALYDACSENFGCIELLKELGAVASEAGEFGDAEYCFAEALNFIMWSLLGPSAGDSGLSRQQLLENCFEKIQRQKLSSCPSALPGQISLDNFLDTLIKMVSQ